MPNRPTRDRSPHREAAGRLTRLIKDRRSELGLSQQALATRAGVSIGTVRAIESGRTIDPGLFTTARLVEGLGLKLGDVLDRVRTTD